MLLWLQTNSRKCVHTCFTKKGWSIHWSVGDCTWTSRLCPSSQGLRSWRAFRDQYHQPVDVQFQHMDTDSPQHVPALCSGSKVIGKLVSKGRLVNHLCWYVCTAPEAPLWDLLWLTTVSVSRSVLSQHRPTAVSALSEEDQSVWSPAEAARGLCEPSTTLSSPPGENRDCCSASLDQIATSAFRKWLHFFMQVFQKLLFFIPSVCL